MTILGVDVASLQGTIDWPKVAASGVRFSIARCVREGDLGVDGSYARNVAGSRAAGITPGAYAFLSGSGRAVTQASLFIATVGDPAGMLIALDVESGALTPTAADVRIFAAAWRSVHPDHPLLIYGSRGSTLGSLGALADLGPLWLADYGANVSETAKNVYTLRGGSTAGQWHSTFGGWTHPVIWQFGSKGRVPGISGDVDIDAIETADLAVLTGSPGETEMAGLGWTMTKVESGTLTINGPGTAALRLRDGVTVNMLAGSTNRYAARIKLDVPYPGVPADSTRQVGFLIGVDPCCMLAVNVTAVPDAAPVAAVKPPVTVTVTTAIDGVSVNSFSKAV